MKIRLGERFWITLTVVIILFTLFIIGRNAVTAIKVQYRIRHLKREKAMYEKRIAEDSTLLDKLQHDEYLEQYAREHYHMQRRNEDVYVME